MGFHLRLVVVAASLAAARAQAATGLEIEAGTPDELCPDLATTREAVRGRLGGILVEEGQGSWRVRYTTWLTPHRPEGRLLRLEIFDPGGRLEKTSDVPAGAESCAELAQILAVKIQAHFRAPGATSTAAAPRRGRFWLGLGGATSSTGPALGLELQAGLVLGRRFSLTASTVLPPGAREEPLTGGGTADLHAVPLRLALGFAALERSRWRLEVGPEALASIERAETNDIAMAAYYTRVVLGLGGAATGVWYLADSLALTLTASLVGNLPLAASQFAVRYPGDRRVEVLRPPPAAGRFSLGIVYVF